jgi:hypothetical protein
MSEKSGIHLAQKIHRGKSQKDLNIVLISYIFSNLL